MKTRYLFTRATKALDFEYFETITKRSTNPANPQRMMRFVEVCIGRTTIFLLSKPEKIMNASLLFS
jgi:hypothetical protein